MAFTSTSHGSDPALVITDAMLSIDHQLTHVPVKSAMQMIEFCRSRLAATEARLLADRYENGATDRDVEDLARSGSMGTSKQEAKKRASRAKATNANPDIAEKLASGEITPEQADVVAEAAEQTDGAAACDADLINDVASTTPEQGRKKAKKFVNDQLDADEVQSRHDRQRRRRGYYRHRLPNGNAAITFHGDDETIDEMEQAAVTGAEAEYQADGGRDVPRHKHPRTNDQRGFDAAAKIFSQSQPEPQSKPKARTPRGVIHVNVTADQLSGRDLTAITSADGKPLPRSLVEELACGCDIIGHVFSAEGELLWQTRKQRLATPAQINGLIARDGGCVLCRAHHSTCVAHHLIPWQAPAAGETNIDNLAFLCGDCHTRVHQRKWTLFYDRRSQTWKTRSAKPHEIPPENQHRRAERKPPIGKYKTKPSRPVKGRSEQLKPHPHEHQNNARLGLF